MFFSAITCEDPGDVLNARKVPAEGPFTCGGHVTYVCHHSYELRGNASLYCHRDGKFAGSLPRCQGTRMYHTKAITMHFRYLSIHAILDIFFLISRRFSFRKLRFWCLKNKSPVSKHIHVILLYAQANSWNSSLVQYKQSICY